MFDDSNPDYLTTIRSSMAIDDSWDLTADVGSTMATYAGLASDDRTFTSFCQDAKIWRQDLNGSHAGQNYTKF